jgi:putative transposase
MLGCQQVLINPDRELQAILEYICTEANKLHNCAVYYARQIYFKTQRYTSSFTLNTELTK